MADRALVPYTQIPEWITRPVPDDLRMALPAPRDVRSAFDLVPAGVQGRPQYPDTNITSLQRAFTRSEIVYAAIQRRSRSAIGPKLLVEARVGPKAEWQEAPGHPLRRLWMRPNPTMDEAAFLRAGIVSMDTAGIFYVEKRRAGVGLPVELWPLNPARIAPIPGADGAPEAYEYKDGSTKTRIPAADMLVRREYNPQSRYHGLSPLAVCLGTVDADQAQTDYVRAFFNNAGVPSGILKVKGRTTQEKSDELRAQWRTKYGRAWGQMHDVAVLDDNAEYQKIGSSLDQLDSESLRTFTESRVCMVFGVPPLIIYAWAGLLRATYSNLKEAWRGFWDATLGPEYEEWRSWLTWNLLLEFADLETIYAERIRLRWDFSAVPAQQEDTDAIQDRGRKNFAAGALTLNELRAIIGEQADPAGNYYLRGFALQAVPVGTPPDSGDAEGGTKRGRGPRAIRARRAAATQGVTRAIGRAATSYLAKEYAQAAKAIRALDKSGPGPGQVRAKVSVGQLGLDDGATVGKLMRRFYPLLLEAAYGDVEDELGDVGLAFDLDNPAVQRILDQLALQVKGVADTTRADIAALIGKQAEEGWSMDQLADEIAILGDVASPSRGQTIARTESAAGYSKGSLLAYKESGVVSGTEWLTGPDSCPICQDLNGQVAKLGETFADGIDAPPAHPRCTCAIAPVLKD